MKKYIDKMVKGGYMLEDGTPLKCSCGHTEFEETNKYYDNFTLVEYQVKCKACGNKVGHWSYGYWDI